MKIKLKSLHLEYFKGIREKDIDFSDITTISGRNASGKTTIASAFFWLLADKDIDLVSNPNITPINVEECSPTVSATLDIDGKIVTLTKMQKSKKSKADEAGIVKVTTTNSYLVNEVPKTERDFKAYLDELGLPSLENILLSSHTEVFTGMKQADMRKFLFSMVSELTDLEIAEQMGNIKEVAELLKNYKMEEISAMHKASIKKCDEQIKNIPAQIEGMELAKATDADTSELELLKNQLNSDIATEEGLIEKLTADKERFASLCVDSLKLDFEKNSEIQKMNDKANEGKSILGKKLTDAHNDLLDIRKELSSLDIDVKYTEDRLKNEKTEFEVLKDKFSAVKTSTFDSSNNICPCCGQEYPAEKKEELFSNFEIDKKKRMDEINHNAKNIQNVISSLESQLQEKMQKYKDVETKLEELELLNTQLKIDYDNFVPTEVAKTPELEEIEKKIEENVKAKELLPKDTDSKISEHKEKLCELKVKLADVLSEIGAMSNNVRIDEQIAELSAKRDEFEQAKADSEKIIYQLELLAKAKNEKLSDMINSYFSIVKFKLWELQKNGGYKEIVRACSLDDKELGISTNTALEVAMKIDICRGIQKFLGIDSPIWVDGAECIDSENLSAIDTGTQMIFLKVTDTDLEIN